MPSTVYVALLLLIEVLAPNGLKGFCKYILRSAISVNHIFLHPCRYHPLLKLQNSYTTSAREYLGLPI